MRRLLPGLLLLAGCGGETSPEEDGPAAEGWRALVTASWHLEPGEEAYVCARIQVTEDLPMGALRPLAMHGTHHAMLMLSEPGPTGTFPCEGTATDVDSVLFAAGPSTGQMTLPEGVALTIPAGSTLLLQVHLLAVGPDAIDGTTAVEGLVVDAGAVEQQAEVVLAGKVEGLTVPPGSSVQTGTCTFPGESRVHAIMPHMHARGRHMRVAARGAAGDVVLRDAPFEVEDQAFLEVEPSAIIAAGEQLLVDCTYDNPGPETLGFGTQASDEMCYAIVVRYPRAGGPPVCEK